DIADDPARNRGSARPRLIPRTPPPRCRGAGAAAGCGSGCVACGRKHRGSRIRGRRLQHGRTSARSSDRHRSNPTEGIQPMTAPRYTCAEDTLTVTDTTTGLQWTRDDVSVDDVTHAEAEAAVEQLNADAFADHSDWRLPTLQELFALADHGRHAPAIDTAAFPSCKNDWYWTSTPYAASPADRSW